MLVTGKYRNTCEKEKVIAEWQAYRNILLEVAEPDSRIPKLGLELTPEQYVNLSIKDCKALYIYTYLIRPWLDKSPEQRYKDKKLEWMSHDCSVWRRYGNIYESPYKPGCTANKCSNECVYASDIGEIMDQQVHDWYKDEYETFSPTEAEILQMLEE